ncbi:MAG: hypothetical protein ACOC3V_01095 [bacterium]
MKFVNKSEYNSIIIRVINKEESKLVQKLLFGYGFSWVSGDNIESTCYGGDTSYIYADFRNMILLYSRNLLDKIHIKLDGLIYHKIYDMNSLNELKLFLKSGQIKPTYLPKKIIR